MTSLDRPDTDIAEALLKRLLQEKGAKGVAALLLEQVTPEERAEIVGTFAIQGLRLVATASERTLILSMIRDAGIEFAVPPDTDGGINLSVEALEAFKRHAKAHPWKPRSGTSPSAHIQEEFGLWLGSGLRREHVAQAQRNLESAYAKEVERHPERRISGLLERPRNLPAGTPPPTARRSGTSRLKSELTSEELEARRAKWRAKARRLRARQKPDP